MTPSVGSKIAAYTSLRASQMINGCVMAAMLIPLVIFLLPTTHSIPRLATAKLRPQVESNEWKLTMWTLLKDYWPMMTQNSALREGLTLRALLIVSYVCYELIARNFVLRTYMHATSDNAEVMITMGWVLRNEICIIP
jgi:hypothetical protein